MFRNRDFKRFSILFLVISLITVIVQFKISTAAGIIALVVDIIFGIAFFIFTYNQYKSIAQISDQIDVVLHNAEHLYIADSEEGELAILQTEIIKMTQRIREQNEALRKEKEHLATSMADIAHQLRTPLTSVNLIMSLLESNADENERKTLIRETKELFMQMDWLLTSLLKLSRIDAGIVTFQRDDIDVSNLIHISVHPFLISLELHNIDMQIEVPKGIAIKGDIAWLSEAVQNVIKNCIENLGHDGVIKIACEDNPLFTEITIHDNGKGFKKEDLPHLFERFYRGKDSNATGYGIGLALCKKIVSGQGGVITAKNHPKGGAIFSIRFSK